MARKVGLTVPRTLITNRREEIRPFLDHCGGEVVFKTMRTHPRRFLETRALTEEAMAHLPMLQLAPTMFQQRIRPQYDIRVTVIGREVFACAIHSPDSEYPLDSRLDMGVKHEAIELDPAVVKKLHALIDELGLVYGAIDLMVTADDEIFFLEVNPGGQFLYIEMPAELPISRAFARLLAGGGRQAEPTKKRRTPPAGRAKKSRKAAAAP